MGHNVLDPQGLQLQNITALACQCWSSRLRELPLLTQKGLELRLSPMLKCKDLLKESPATCRYHPAQIHFLGGIPDYKYPRVWDVGQTHLDKS